MQKYLINLFSKSIWSIAMRLVPKQFETGKRRKHNFEEDYNENGKIKLQQTTRSF